MLVVDSGPRGSVRKVHSTLMIRTRINGAAARGHQIALALRAAYLTMHRRTEASFDELGVTADQFVILAALARRSAVTQRDLALRTASDPNTVRAMLLLLERRGLVARPPHHTDARARMVVLTARGRRAFRKLWKRSESVRVLLTRTLGAADGSALLAALQRIARAFAPRDEHRLIGAATTTRSRSTG